MKLFAITLAALLSACASQPSKQVASPCSDKPQVGQCADLTRMTHIEREQALRNLGLGLPVR
jgi:uncharacterized lipoprotein YmbA